MIQNYINYISSVRGYSPQTAKAYAQDLRHFATWARENMQDARWSKIDRNIIDKYVIDAERNEQAPATTNRRLASLSGFYNYLKRQGYEIENPCKYESRRKVAERVPNTISIYSLQNAYAAADGAVKVMLGILITTGIRIGELLSIHFEDIDCEQHTIVIRGKGGHDRIVKTTSQALEIIRTLKEERHAVGPIFTVSDRMARRMIYEALKPYSQDRQLSPHAIRHTFATHLAASGENVTTIATILGHRHIETTQKYIDMAAAQNEQAAINNPIIK